MNESLKAELAVLKLYHRDWEARSKDQQQADHYSLMHMLAALSDSGFTVVYPIGLTTDVTYPK